MSGSVSTTTTSQQCVTMLVVRSISPTIPSTQATLLVRAATWFSDYWPQALTVAGGVGMAGYQVFAPKDWIIIFILSAIVFVVGGYGLIIQSPRITRLQQQLVVMRQRLNEVEQAYATVVEQMRQQSLALCEPQLQALANSLNFTDRERISVYKHEHKQFLMLGRYSKNPRYNERGRSSYPEDQGCIGRAYFNEEAFDDNMPDPQPGLGAYCDHQINEWGIPKNVCESFTMKSRNIAAFALDDATRTRRIAVIVFESADPNRLNMDELRSSLLTQEGIRVAHYAEKLQMIKTDTNQAGKAGF